MRVEIFAKKIEGAKEIPSDSNRNVAQASGGASRWNTEEIIPGSLWRHRHFHTYGSGAVVQTVTLFYTGEFKEEEAFKAVSFFNKEVLVKSGLFSDELLQGVQ